MRADMDISDDLFEKIVAFVDREAGRDAPLTDNDRGDGPAFARWRRPHTICGR